MRVGVVVEVIIFAVAVVIMVCGLMLAALTTHVKQSIDCGNCGVEIETESAF